MDCEWEHLGGCTPAPMSAAEASSTGQGCSGSLRVKSFRAEKSGSKSIKNNTMSKAQFSPLSQFSPFTSPQYGAVALLPLNNSCGA